MELIKAGKKFIVQAPNQIEAKATDKLFFIKTSFMKTFRNQQQQ